MRSPEPPSGGAERHLLLISTDEEVVLHLLGFAVLRAGYEAEGYYDEAADGNPAEQDLYRVEILDASLAARAAEAIEGEPGPLADLGLAEPVAWRLFPSARWTPDGDALGLVERYLLVLAHALRAEQRPEARQRLLEGSSGWAPEVILDAFHALPAGWRDVASR
jgi:hypothetical protein